MFRNTTVVSEADKLRSALACSSEPWILQRQVNSAPRRKMWSLGGSRAGWKGGGMRAWHLTWGGQAGGASSQMYCHTANRYLQYTLSDMIRRQDATSTINSIARNVVGQSLVWDFVRANWKTLFNQ
ncbi:hypothetical protein JD844_014802 [Phrynosoma platyrhinos]|uniref:ERAP1-like C-terminal domain-containing protein n=1 Tax=Phrynosoma platyrhinos TaxID=52577 RepID=A0ABQ7SS65_PHRPL|nr:hypothetical protein JD844_014802 [Phrynosoma platyrhinos]